MVSRESIWARAYILRLEPAAAAKLAEREYDATHLPSVYGAAAEKTGTLDRGKRQAKPPEWS